MGNRQRQKKAPSKAQRTTRSDREQQIQRLMTYVGVAAVALVLVLVGLFVVDVGSVIRGEAKLSTENQPTLGSPDAPVEVVEFADFKCPACSVFKTQVFPDLKANYIDTGKIRFSFLNFPLPIGPDSWIAANAVECVYHEIGNGAFWDYYHGLFVNQGPEHQTWATPDLLVQLAQDYIDRPVDTDSLRSCIVDERYRGEAERDREMGVTAEIPGTPTVFVNGQMLRDFRYGTIAGAIDRALQHSESSE